MSELTDEDAGDVRDWLDRNQFQHVSSLGGDTTAFGDRQDVWERDGTLVRLSRDRGQWWVVRHVTQRDQRLARRG
jgi:hypothetical protein